MSAFWSTRSQSRLPVLAFTVILLQAENEFSAGTNRSPYMQDVIDLYRANGIVIRTFSQVFIYAFPNSFDSHIAITHNDQHAGGTGNFSPDLPGTGRVDIYW